MPWKWYDSKVIRIEQESPTTKRFWLEVEEEPAIPFKAGQFVTMDLPIHEKRLKRWRSYSIASPPDGSNILEFCVVHLVEGGGSGYLFNEAEVGTKIRFKGPDGTFTLPEKLEKDIVFLCTGTGVAPFRSMLLDVFRKGKEHKRLHLIFGTRHESGILYRHDFEYLLEQMTGFRYDVALSRADQLPENTGWGCYKGYIHQIYLKEYETVRPDVDFYICGWSQMIDEAVENLLLKLGYDKSQIHYELYG